MPVAGGISGCLTLHDRAPRRKGRREN